MRKYLLTIFFKPALTNFDVFLILLLVWLVLGQHYWWAIAEWIIGSAINGIGAWAYEKFAKN